MVTPYFLYQNIAYLRACNMDDIKALRAVSSQGICGAITGRAIYEGTLDVAEAQAYSDSFKS